MDEHEHADDEQTEQLVLHHCQVACHGAFDLLLRVVARAERRVREDGRRLTTLGAPGTNSRRAGVGDAYSTGGHSRARMRRARSASSSGTSSCTPSMPPSQAAPTPTTTHEMPSASSAMRSRSASTRVG